MTIPSTVLHSKTHVTICLRCCWWRNPWCHSQVTTMGRHSQKYYIWQI